MEQLIKRKIMFRQSLVFTFLISCSFSAFAQKSDNIFHYSVMDAMRNSVYDGEITIADLKKNGDFGLGTYNFLDGELLALDGVFYRIAPDGKVIVAEDSRKSPFAAMAFFKFDKKIEIKGGKNMDSFLLALKHLLPSNNQPYAIKIECEWDEISVGGATKVTENDTLGLAEKMKTRPIYTAKRIKGTLVGFYNPAYAGGIDLSPFHFHFISNDKKFGGHLVSGQLSNTVLNILLDEKTGYTLELPKKSKRFNESWKAENNGKSTY